MVTFATSGNGGYRVADALGKVFTFGDAPNDGGTSGTHLSGPIIAASGSQQNRMQDYRF
jgi:hypothetical protein